MHQIERQRAGAIGEAGLKFPTMLDVRAPLEHGYACPTQDLGTILERLGCALTARDRTPAQYVCWSVREGLFRFLGQCASASVSEVTANTSLTECGADSLLGVLTALHLVFKSPDGRYQLTDVARDYFLETSPYFIGDQLRPMGYPIPGAYLRRRASILTQMKLRLLRYHPSIRYGSRDRIRNQHARNLAACAVAARTGEFGAVRCMVDMAGGSGTFAIPFALDHPNARVVMADLPAAMRRAATILTDHGLHDRVELVGMDAFQFPWRIPRCDGLFIGNFLHGFDDETCLRVCRESFDRLEKGGRLWVHEMLWNEAKDGPLITALLHAAMRMSGPGRQRTAGEISSILSRSGFSSIRVTQTAGCYALVSGERPR